MGQRSVVKVIPWDKYKKRLPLFAFASIFQCIFAFFLFNDNVYTDKLFNIFGALNIVYGVLRIGSLFANERIIISKETSIRRAPFLAWIDFGGFFIALGLMDILYGRHSSAALATDLGLMGIGFFLFALFPLLSMVAFSLGFGRPPSS